MMDAHTDPTKTSAHEGLQKLSKQAAGYIELEAFRGSDHHTGYFCNSCHYWRKPEACDLVATEGPDVEGKPSAGIAAHGCCNLWAPNWDEIHPQLASGRGSGADAGAGEGA